MQDQRLTTVNFRSGIVKELTPKAAEGFWTDADKIRFRFNKVELMGGWQRVTTEAASATLYGMPRLLETLEALDGVRAAVLGTEIGLWSSNLSAYFEITPVVTVVATTDILNTTSGATAVLVSVSNHGLTTDSLVGIVSANTTIGGNILLNTTTSTSATYQISVVNANSFELRTSVTAAETSAGTGGAVTLYLYYPAGQRSEIRSSGWGGGTWNSGAWNTATNATIVTRGRLWSADQWGTELMLVPSGGPLYRWSTLGTQNQRPALVTAAPVQNQIVRVASESRHVILYGTRDIGGDYDPLLVRWCSQEDYDDWVPTLTNTAGDQRLNSRGSRIVGVAKIRDQHLILTDADAFLQSYIGPNDVFGFSKAGENCGLIGQNAAVEYSGAVYWMSNLGQFFKYDGRLQPLPCSVLRYIYENLDTRYYDKIYAGTNTQFDELIWLYPDRFSANGEPNRYVIYNVVENHWNIGTLERTAWKDRSIYSNILAAGYEFDGLFYHEVGRAADTTVMSAYAESAYFDLQDGDAIMFCNKVVPDFRTLSDATLTDNVEITLKARKYPGDSVITKGPYIANNTVDKISTRLRGREFALRINSETSAQAAGWRLGEVRMAIQPDGKR